ncbi:hypothetical protein INT48_001765 [Thamnidium elegans]|uniref:Tag1-like fifth Ig-like domain-containing protein n=1 Tax=Thamnidium elegans TaxID=101142 RepID=A0A8H7SZE7_9FUNG|nr:hypothetical protein INT48_001765 [Thamnidium elegans]
MSYNNVGEGSSSGSTRLPSETRKGKYPANQHTPEEAPLIVSSSFSSSQPYGAIAAHDTQPPSRPSQKTCTYIIILATACTASFLFILLWLAPTFAERIVKQDVQFTFQQASILNVSKHKVITMHVIGSIELDSNIFHLQQKFNNIFGTIGIQQTELNVFYQKASDSFSMGSIDLPALDLNHGSAVTDFDFVTDFLIDDTDALMEFCKDAVVAETVLWRVVGPLSVSLGWLPWKSNVVLDKTVAIEGMNGLQKTDMKSMLFPGTHPLGGVSLSATVGIFNPSNVLSLTLGDMDFGIYLPSSSEKDVPIAIVQAIDADLQGHRMNYFNVTGRTLPISNTSQELMETFLTGYLHGNTTIVHVRGSLIGPDDQPSKKHVSSIPLWLRQALEQVVIRVPFPGATETDLIQSLQLSHIKIDFSSTGSPLISGDAVALLKKPQEMQFHMDVTEIDPLVYLYLNQDSERPFATIRSDKPCAAKSEDGNGIDLPLGTMKVTSRLSRAPFTILPGGQKDFDEFLNRVFKQKKGKVYIRGTSDAKVESAFGNLSIRDLEFNGVIETQGLDGMKHPAPKVTSMTIVKGYADALHARTVLSIYSPSDVHINLGQLNMVLLFNGHSIGNTTIPELSLAPGVDNELTVSAWLSGKNKHVIDFIGQYISNGISSNNSLILTISGQHPNASPSKFLNNFLQHLTFDVKAPEFIEQPLLADCQMNILSSSVIMSLRNPFQGVDMSITKINATATYQIYELGRLTADFEDAGEGWRGPLLLPPPVCDQQDSCKSVVVESEKIPIKTKKLGYEAVKRALGGYIEVSVDSTVGVMIDDFVLADLQYRQDNITARVSKGF